MEDTNRKLLDGEIGRLRNKLSALEPDTEEYSKILTALCKHEQVAIEDDKIKSQESQEALNRGFDSEKFETEVAERKRSYVMDIVKLGTTSIVTLSMCIITIVANRNVQLRAQQFESQGYDYTSKSTKFFNKLPPVPRM